MVKKSVIQKKKFLIMNSDIMYEDEADLEDIIFHGVTLSIKKLDNIVKTDSGHIVQIMKIINSNKIFFYMVIHSRMLLMFFNIHVLHQKLE